MAIVFDGPVTPDALTTFVRNVPTPAQYILNQVLPDRFFDRNNLDLGEITRTNRTARFRAYDGRLHVSERDLTSLKQVKLPPLSSSLSTGEYERLQLEFARTGGTNTAALVNAVYDDATNLTNEVIARMEQARGDVLTDGKFTLAGEGGLFLEADYGVPGTHVVTAATLWSTVATATPLTDLIAWLDVYKATNGFLPGAILTSQRVQRFMQRSTELINAVAGSNTGRTRLQSSEVNGLLDSEGIPPLMAAYDSLVDVDGVSTRIIPDNKVIFLPPNPTDLGYTAWGVSATALELVGSNAVDLDFSEAPGIVGVVEKSGPPYREFTFVDAVGMPVLANARLLFVATVA